ncbi:MAG: arsenate reductase ArsC [Planctomycetes bacterium]|nr:arsenate reductase ArsC [Planctomycetota bacterium]MBU1517753.1 arsenate reductase ArsC [Planctomycetota bacterium]MBU2457831.1 arsenate reductase ArsC [Planctomycetota bacterium]MBU2596663.1 arsenate reductase ArsC [Planctomycetota bacterium]
MAEKKEKLNILFLCTGNSCRSQMAEGWAKKLKSDCIEAFSAGVYPVGVNSRAVKIMAEAGVDISAHRSKHADDLCGIDFDYVITLCDNAKELCPVYNGKTKLIHKPFSDPSILIGSEEVITDAFRKVRDQIRDFVLTLPDALAQEKNGGKK